MNRWAPKKQTGFTIVELLIVIIIIGILAAIITVSFRGIQSRTLETTAKSSLRSASKLMETMKITNGAYPTTLPETIRSSSTFTFSLVASTLPYYENITAVQNGVLLSQICQDLVNEGKGSGTNLGGGTDAYITGCGNWNHGSMQVTGWTSRVFATPIAASTFTDYAATVPSGDAWHPNQQSVVRGFYSELNSRLLAQGGSYPLTSFWDSWATPGNGVQYEALPPASPGGNNGTYCIQAAASGNRNWYVRASGDPMSGTC